MNITQRTRLVRQHAAGCDNRNAQSAAGAYKEPIRRPGCDQAPVPARTGRPHGSSSVHPGQAPLHAYAAPCQIRAGSSRGIAGAPRTAKAAGRRQVLHSPLPPPSLPFPPLPLSVSCYLPFPPLPRRHTERGTVTGPAPRRAGYAAQRATRMPRTSACRARSWQRICAGAEAATRHEITRANAGRVPLHSV